MVICTNVSKVSYLCYRRVYVDFFFRLAQKPSVAWDISLLIPGQIGLIISSVITSQGYFNSVLYWDSHISTCSIKTLVIYLHILCISCLCQLIVFVIYYCCSSFIIVVHLFCSLFNSNLFFVRLLFHCSLFKRKRFNSDPGLYSRYFDPIIPADQQFTVVQEYHHHICKSINIIHQTAPTLSV
jgi:hypothetical protein